MAGRPPIRYALSGAVQVAYQVTGDGPVDLVLAPGTASHLSIDWEWPARARMLDSLSSFCRLIRFDKRGTGLSDRPTDAAILEERTLAGALPSKRRARAPAWESNRTFAPELTGRAHRAK